MKAAFLIEGANRWEGLYENVASAVKLANANGCKKFDPIEPYSAKFVTAVIEELAPADWPLFIIVYLTMADTESDIDDIIRTQVLPGFRALHEKGVISALPAWLTTLTADTLDSFVAQQKKYLFSDCEQTFLTAAADLLRTMRMVRASISMQNLVDFLTENQEITQVFSMVSEEQFEFIDVFENAEIIEASDTMCKYKINLEDREVIVELYVGKQGSLDHFDEMQRACIDHGLVFAETAPSEETSLTSVLTGVFDNVSSALDSVVDRLKLFAVVNHMQTSCRNSGLITPEVDASALTVMNDVTSLHNLLMTQLHARSLSGQPYRGAFFSGSIASVEESSAHVRSTLDCRG